MDESRMSFFINGCNLSCLGSQCITFCWKKLVNNDQGLMLDQLVEKRQIHRRQPLVDYSEASEARRQIEVDTLGKAPAGCWPVCSVAARFEMLGSVVVVVVAVASAGVHNHSPALTVFLHECVRWLPPLTFSPLLRVPP